MDVAPPWHQLSTDLCTGEVRSCAGGDAACREQARQEGFVAQSPYLLCRPRDTWHVPSPSGAALLVVALLAAGGTALWRRRRLASTPPTATVPGRP